jgi:hypothetical protein
MPSAWNDPRITGTHPMTKTDRLAAAAHLHVLLRRKLGRVTDVEWMVENDDYARAMVRLALADHDHPELVALGHRLQALLPMPAPAAAEAPRAAADTAPRYVRSLR